MKGGTEFAKRLRTYVNTLRRGRGRSATAGPRCQTIEQELVLAVLTQNTAEDAALRTLRRLNECMVDLNELRVTSPGDLLHVLEKSLPEPAGKARQITALLHAIYDKRNSLSLSFLRNKTIRDARQYLELLDGITPFVSAAVVQRCLGGHAIPIDEATVRLLKDLELINESAAVPEITAFLERHVKSADGPWFATVLHQKAIAHLRRKTGSPAPSSTGKRAARRRASPRSGKSKKKGAGRARARKPRRASGARR